jgi:hypothetical protein
LKDGLSDAVDSVVAVAASALRAFRAQRDLTHRRDIDRWLRSLPKDSGGDATRTPTASATRSTSPTRSAATGVRARPELATRSLTRLSDIARPTIAGSGRNEDRCVHGARGIEHGECNAASSSLSVGTTCATASASTSPATSHGRTAADSAPATPTLTGRS